MSADLCPYCARRPDQGRGPTRDHVFVAALGGRARVTACRDCNSTIGHDVEGPLLKPGTVLNLIAQVRDAGHPLPGTLPDDQAVTYDLRTQELRLAKPVKVTRSGDTRSVEMRGSPAQVRQLLAQQGIRGEQADAMIAAARTVTTPHDRVTTTLTLDIVLSDRLAAKTALGCAELAFGDTAVLGPLGDLLRDALWARTTAVEHLEHAVAAAVDGVLAGTGLGTQVHSFAPGPASQAVFVPLDGHRTGVVVHLAGSALGAGGLVVDAPMPAGHELPVLVRDQPGGALIADMTTDVVRTVAALDQTPERLPAAGERTSLDEPA